MQSCAVNLRNCHDILKMKKTRSRLVIVGILGEAIYKNLNKPYKSKLSLDFDAKFF